MPESLDTRDKVIALETDVKYLRASVDHMSAQVEEIHNLLQQARGARYVIVLAASIGGFIAGKIGWLLPWFSR